MKQLISLAACLLIVAACFSQDDFVDTVKPASIPRGKGAISMGILLGDNQRFNAQQHAEAILISPPTIIEQRPGYVKLYVNTDFVTIVCEGITEKNYRNYTAFKGMPGVKTSEFFEIHHSLSANNLSIIDDAALNTEKVQLRNRRFYYFIRDNKTGNTAAELSVEFVTPAPEPAYISFSDTMTNNIKKMAGIVPVVSKKTLEHYRKEMLAAKKRGDTNLVLPPGKKALWIYFKTLNRVHHAVEYRLNGGDWKTSAETIYPSILLDDLRPGEQHLEVRYPGREGGIFKYKFEVQPGPLQTTAFKVFVGSCITAFFCVGLFWLNAVRQKQKLRKEVQQRAHLQNQLNALQSRLHPHFIFNALNSIQGLINKSEIAQANLYMSKFGALLHDIIGKSDQPMHPLTVELKQVEYYLQLEQLRFKFRYSLVVSEGINTSEINIPTLLVQPFIENAIKHGIAEKREDGWVSVAIEKDKTNLLIQISDNGNGYDTAAPTAGRGNKMVQERIDTLNEFLTGQKISLHIRSNAAEGTRVSLYFYDWL